ncbi:MAG: hypothetical protein IJL67_03975 [Oscillospiraceae bacterium]|nr:hypothetical protein [Oscillospiraceae bacterium]
MSEVYDGAFRSIINKCSKFVLPFINETFGENYSGSEQIVFYPNEHFIIQNEDVDKRRITDTNFTVIGEEKKNYHLECESSSYSDNMLLRIFEYDTQIALDNSKVTEDAITVSLPHTAILYLRSSRRTPKKLKISIEVPGGKRVSYNVPVVRMKSYTIEQIFEKKLYMLIPFYIFNFEKELPACEKKEEKLKILESKFQQISDRLIGLRDKGEITALEYDTIASLSKDVINQIAKKYKSVSKGVGDIMRGPMIITEGMKIYDEGVKIGIDSGRALERDENAKIMLFDGVSDDLVIKYSGISPDRLEKLKAEMAKN